MEALFAAEAVADFGFAGCAHGRPMVAPGANARF